MTSDEVRIVHSENPVKDMWSRLGYFENEHNVREFLREDKKLDEEALLDTAKRLAFTMQTAREYYKSASRVSLLTQPLLIFYGMVALSKVLFIATYGKESPSKGHGLETPNQKDFEEDFAKLSTRIQRDGTFPQFHSCFCKDKFFNIRFTIKELLSTVCEIKVEYETVYHEKSQAIKAQKDRFGLRLVDTELKKYGDLEKELSNYFSFSTVQSFENSLLIWNPENIHKTRALSGEEYLVLPLKKNEKRLFLPEMSTHFLVMYLLGMVSRYYPKQWGEIIEGKTSGEIYIIRKFLETTTRKFPNLILNRLWNRAFVFVSPQPEREKRLDDNELERIYDYVQEKTNRELRSLGF